MLKVSKQQGQRKTVLRIEGRLVTPWTTELEAAWTDIAKTLGDRELLLDLRGVIFVDQTGTAILKQIVHSANASLLADSPLTRHFVEQVRQFEPVQQQGRKYQ